MLITISLQLLVGLLLITNIFFLTMMDDRDDPGKGLMHAGGYMMTRITDKGCATDNHSQEIIIL